MKSGHSAVPAARPRRVSAARVVGIVLVLSAAALALISGAALAQPGKEDAPSKAPVKERALPGRFPGKPSRAPAFTIPVERLGFGAPGAIYFGERIAQVSLDFMGENRLLFSFRVPALLRRDGQGSEERRIRAVVLALPSGTVEAETSWTLHGYPRYLWMLHGNHFLLRNGNELLEGGATLALKPLLAFPGPLLSLQTDPTGQFMVTISREPLEEARKPGSTSHSSGASAGAAGRDSGSPPEYVLRVLRREPSRVILVRRMRRAIQLAINSGGYVENLRGGDSEWVLNFNSFTGGSRIIGNVESACMPEEDFISTSELLVTACSATGGDRLIAMTRDGRVLWKYLTPATDIWPQLVMAPNGLRIARETLVTNYAVGPFHPLGDVDSLNGQLVRVFDATTGDLVLQTPVKPVLDGGGNVAISPSGRRVAVLNGHAIQVFELPSPPPLPPPPPPAANGKPKR